MCHNRVSSVHNLRIISSLIEHTHVEPQDICIVDCTVHSTLIWGNNHHVVLIDIEIPDIQEQSFNELIGTGHIVKRVSRNRIHHSRIVCIKG